MTSIEYRNSAGFLRNDFPCEGKWGFPIIQPQEIDTCKLGLISYSDTSARDTKNLDKGVHFFIDDYRFESLYSHPDQSISKLSKYAFLLTPDYSQYADMPLWRQIESTGKSRWVGANWQSKGLKVIPTVTWGLSQTFEFCFDALPHEAIVAVGMIGCKQNRLNFLRGYNAMLETLSPKIIIVFGEPFPEMEGNIVRVDYMASRREVR